MISSKLTARLEEGRTIKKEAQSTSIWHRRVQGAYWGKDRTVRVQARYSTSLKRMGKQVPQTGPPLKDLTSKGTGRAKMGIQCF
jgi:hypothetical protein